MGKKTAIACSVVTITFILVSGFVVSENTIKIESIKFEIEGINISSG